MKSIGWPTMFESTTKTAIVTDREATIQNLKSLLWTTKRDLFGDPYYGAGLERFLYEQNDPVLLSLAQDAIYITIKQFMPQLECEREDITVKSNNRTMYAEIKAFNKIELKTDLYNIILLSNEV